MMISIYLGFSGVQGDDLKIVFILGKWVMTKSVRKLDSTCFFFLMWSPVFEQFWYYLVNWNLDNFQNTKTSDPILKTPKQCSVWIVLTVRNAVWIWNKDDLEFVVPKFSGYVQNHLLRASHIILDYLQAYNAKIRK